MNGLASESINSESEKRHSDLSAFPKISPASFGALSGILGVTALLYSTTVGDFFLGDDFIHLPWLLAASHDPIMVLKGFTTSWLGATSVQFYRPLISVSLFFDYLVWGVNGFGYHLSNLLYHLISSIALFLIVRNVNRSVDQSLVDSETQPLSRLRTFLRSDLAPLAAAAMFAVYAVHPEAVCWIVGRTDGLCSMFVLLSMWCYTQAQFLHSFKWTALSLTTLALALTCKEMAIPTPALFLAYSFLFPALAQTAKQLTNAPEQTKLPPMVSGALTALRATVPYWILLAVYFVVRRLALGTFVGGYDNSLFFLFPLQIILQGWANSLANFVVPANQELVSPRSPLRYIWAVALTLSPLLTLALSKSRLPVLRLFAFYAVWLLLEFAPIFKAFILNEILQGGRLVYLASAPFSVLIVFGWTLLFFAGKAQKIMATAALVVMLSISSYFLWMNNSAWADAGAQSKAIGEQLDELYKNEPGDPANLFCGVPNDLHGAWLGINAFEGLTKQPRMARTLQRASCLIPADRVSSYGFLRDDCVKLASDIHIFRWDMEARKFFPLLLPKDNKAAHQSWARDDFKGSDGKSLNLIASPSKPGNAAHLDIDFSNKALQCFNANTIEFEVTILSLPPDASAHLTNLRYEDDVQYKFDEVTQESQMILPFAGAQKIAFPMRENVNWWLGGKCRKLRLEFPPGWSVRVDKISCDYGTDKIPTFAFDIKKNRVMLGIVALNSQNRSTSLKYDVSHIKGAKSALLEMTRPNTPFETHNSSHKSLSTEKTFPLPKTIGDIKIDTAMIAGPGIYQFRVHAVDSFGIPIGFASDHVMAIVQ